MTYTPMHIEHIDDVLPFVSNRQDFVVAHKDGYTVIDYVYALPETFDHPARIECRGIKFAPDGTILERPLHKFFNVGERTETQPHLLDFTQPHTVMEKLDGSMIHPAIVDGEVVFMTRMGCTDHARKAERHLSERIADVIIGNPDITLIFEWTAPDNRIVVPYRESALTLLACRHKISGAYLPHSGLHEFADAMGVPVVPIHTLAHASGADFIAHARAVRGMEGFVVRFDNGLMVKAKGEDYVLKHKAKESVLQEKNVLQLVLRDELDDVLPLLEPEDREAIERYASAVLAGIHATAVRLDAYALANSYLDQKSYAQGVANDLPRHLSPLAFQVRAGKDARQSVVDAILKKCGTQTAVDSVRPLFGAVFDLGGFVLDEAA